MKRSFSEFHSQKDIARRKEDLDQVRIPDLKCVIICKNHMLYYCNYFVFRCPIHIFWVIWYDCLPFAQSLDKSLLTCRIIAKRRYEKMARQLSIYHVHIQFIMNCELKHVNDRSYGQSTDLVSISDFYREEKQRVLLLHNTEPLYPLFMQNVQLNLPIYWRANCSLN